MRYLLLLFPFVYNASLAQQKEGTVSISCYVNPELYIQASVIAHVSDKAGNASCNGRYVNINNKSGNAFFYKKNNSWVVVKPQGKTVVLLADANTAPSKSPSVFKLNVKYKSDASGSMSTKLRTITQMNAQTDKVQAREFEGDNSKTQEQDSNKPSNEALANNNKPSTVETSKTPAAKATPSKAPVVNAPAAKNTETDSKKKVVAKAKPKTPPKQNRPESGPERKQGVKNAKLASATAIGLRVDFGKGSAGLGPNIKHKFNRNLSFDAAIVFFEGDLLGVGAQVEQNFPVKGTPALNWYIGIGPQFLLGNENTAIALVPVTGLEYNIPGAPLNFSFDWRPNFYLSPGADVETGRFGLSLRIAL